MVLMNCTIKTDNKVSKNIYSYSKLNTYKFCPQKYKIHYLDKVRKPNESIEAFMGKRVHEVLEWFFNQRSNVGSFCTVDFLLNKIKTQKLHARTIKDIVKQEITIPSARFIVNNPKKREIFIKVVDKQLLIY